MIDRLRQRAAHWALSWVIQKMVRQRISTLTLPWQTADNVRFNLTLELRKHADERRPD